MLTSHVQPFIKNTFPTERNIGGVTLESHVTTRAVQFLKRKRIPFEEVRYAHEEKGADFAARAIGFPLEQTVKTLVVDLGHRKYCLALVPGDRRLDFKRLAALFGVKRSTLTDTVTAERLTGYLVGGISPFGTKHKLPAILDEKVCSYDTLVVNGGQRGVMLKMTPKDIEMALQCSVAALARD